MTKEQIKNFLDVLEDQCPMDSDGMTYEEAVEWIDYNVVRALAYYGEKAPIIINRFLE